MVERSESTTALSSGTSLPPWRFSSAERFTWAQESGPRTLSLLPASHSMQVEPAFTTFCNWKTKVADDVVLRTLLRAWKRQDCSSEQGLN